MMLQSIQNPNTNATKTVAQMKSLKWFIKNAFGFFRFPLGGGVEKIRRE